MQKKICPLTIPTGNPSLCRKDCAWATEYPYEQKYGIEPWNGGWHCAIQDVTRVLVTADHIGATIEKKR